MCGAKTRGPRKLIADWLSLSIPPSRSLALPRPKIISRRASGELGSQIVLYLWILFEGVRNGKCNLYPTLSGSGKIFARWVGRMRMRMSIED